MNSQYSGELISGLTKACEIAENNAKQRSNERSIVVSTHGETITVTERRGLTPADPEWQAAIDQTRHDERYHEDAE
jgi:hypothetical protein